MVAPRWYDPGIVSEGEPLLVELLLERRSIDTGADGDDEALLVDLDDLVEASEVEADPAVGGERASLGS